MHCRGWTPVFLCVFAGSWSLVRELYESILKYSVFHPRKSIESALSAFPILN